MNGMLTAAIGVGLFYLLLHPDRVKNTLWFFIASLCFVASLLPDLLTRFGTNPAKVAAVLSVLLTAATVVFVFLAINPFKIPLLGGAPKPAAPPAPTPSTHWAATT